MGLDGWDDSHAQRCVNTCGIVCWGWGRAGECVWMVNTMALMHDDAC